MRRRRINSGGEFHTTLKETFKFFITPLRVSADLILLARFAKDCRVDLIHTKIMEEPIKTFVGNKHNFIIQVIETYGMLRDSSDEIGLEKGLGTASISEIISKTVSLELEPSSLVTKSELLIDILIMLSIHDDLY